LAFVEVAATEPLAPPNAYTLLDERTYGAGRVVILELAVATKPDRGCD
jgi:hypothetical protein